MPAHPLPNFLRFASYRQSSTHGCRPSTDTLVLAYVSSGADFEICCCRGLVCSWCGQVIFHVAGWNPVSPGGVEQWAYQLRLVANSPLYVLVSLQAQCESSHASLPAPFRLVLVATAAHCQQLAGLQQWVHPSHVSSCRQWRRHGPEVAGALSNL